MPEFIYSMHNVRKSLGDKVVLDNVTLSFYPGAKIGVVGPNGTGKSTLLKLMAGLEKPSNGDAMLAKDATVGILLQEPPLTEDKTVLENVEEAVADIKALQARMDELGMAMAEPDADFDALMAEMGDVQTELDNRNAWDIDSQLEQAMDALRCPPPDDACRRPVRWRAAPRRAVQAAAAAARSAAAGRADQPPRRRVGALARGSPQGLPGCGAGRHPRPVLPGQRRRVDPRARPRPHAPVRGQLLHLPGDQEVPAADRGQAGRQAGQDPGARAGVGPVQPEGPAGEEQGPAGPVRGAGGRGRAEPQARLRGDQHPAGSPAGQQRARRHGPGQGLRRPHCCSTGSASTCPGPASSAWSVRTASASRPCSG